MTTMPRSSRMSSASVVVGPLAASTMRLRLDLAGVALGDLASSGGRNQDIAGQLQQLGVAIHGLRVRQAAGRAMFLHIAERHVDVDAVFVVDAAEDIGQADDLAARARCSRRAADRADVAEALHDDAASQSNGMSSTLQASRMVMNTPRPVASDAPWLPPMAQRLAGDDGRDRIAVVHGVGVHDPGHDLRVGVDVGRGDVAVRPDECLRSRWHSGGSAAPARRARACRDRR